MSAKILTNEPQADPVWMRALDRYGIAVVGWVAVGIAIWTWGDKWVEVTLEARQQSQAETSAFLQAQIESSAAQTRAIEKLSNSADLDREFQAAVVARHDMQTSVLMAIEDNTKDTNVRMTAAEEAMSYVPGQREQTLVLLREIADGVKAQNDG